jgi:hypothetical protein
MFSLSWQWNQQCGQLVGNVIAKVEKRAKKSAKVTSKFVNRKLVVAELALERSRVVHEIGVVIHLQGSLLPKVSDGS